MIQVQKASASAKRRGDSPAPARKVTRHRAPLEMPDPAQAKLAFMPYDKFIDKWQQAGKPKTINGLMPAKKCLRVGGKFHAPLKHDPSKKLYTNYKAADGAERIAIPPCVAVAYSLPNGGGGIDHVKYPSEYPYKPATDKGSMKLVILDPREPTSEKIDEAYRSAILNVHKKPLEASEADRTVVINHIKMTEAGGRSAMWRDCILGAEELVHEAYETMKTCYSNVKDVQTYMMADNGESDFMKAKYCCIKKVAVVEPGTNKKFYYWTISLSRYVTSMASPGQELSDFPQRVKDLQGMKCFDDVEIKDKDGTVTGLGNVNFIPTKAKSLLTGYLSPLAEELCPGCVVGGEFKPKVSDRASLSCQLIFPLVLDAKKWQRTEEKDDPTMRGEDTPSTAEMAALFAGEAIEENVGMAPDEYDDMLDSASQASY